MCNWPHLTSLYHPYIIFCLTWAFIWFQGKHKVIESPSLNITLDFILIACRQLRFWSLVIGMHSKMRKKSMCIFCIIVGSTILQDFFYHVILFFLIIISYKLCLSMFSGNATTATGCFISSSKILILASQSMIIPQTLKHRVIKN